MNRGKRRRQFRRRPAEIGLRVGRHLAKRVLFAGDAAPGRRERLMPIRCPRQGAEQASVKKGVGALRLAAERRSVAPRRGQDDAVGPGHGTCGKPAAVAGRDDDHGRHGGAAARQCLRQLFGMQRPLRAREPKSGVVLAMGGQKHEAAAARLRRQAGNAPEQVRGGRGLGAAANFGSAGAQPVDVGSENSGRAQPPVQGAGGVVEDRLRVVAGRQHDLPIVGVGPIGAGGRAGNAAAAEERRRQHQDGEPPKKSRKH